MDIESQRPPPPPPVAAAGSPTSRWLADRVAYVAADHSTMLLWIAMVLLVSLAFIIYTITYWSSEPRLVLMYFIFILFNAALYFRRRLLRHWPPGLSRRHHLRPWLRHGRRRWIRRWLRYAAIVLGASFVFSFVVFYGFPTMPTTMPSSSSSPLRVGVTMPTTMLPSSSPPIRLGVFLGLLVVGEYFFYRLLVLHFDEEEEAIQMHARAQG